ncbi:MAG: phosphatidylserine decarboxylase [Nitrospirae bacterium]|nr:phosphatidylserine decarboxylase [Nitrospirota bacterium]
MLMTQHQYIDRKSGKIVTEKLFGDRLIHWLYSSVKESAPALFKMLTGARMSEFMGFLNYETALCTKLTRYDKFLGQKGINLDECLEPPEKLSTPRRLFERKIRYWETRIMPEDESAVVCPSDARVIVGSLKETSFLPVKGKLFSFEELIGEEKTSWLKAFAMGDFAIFRLTPEKYHYNHAPVSGVVADFYDIAGRYHSCNPAALAIELTPYSKNRRSVTIVDTSVPGGMGCGLVAMVEVAALMIGDIRQCYSDTAYDNPRDMEPGMFIKKGRPKSLFRPGGSTVVLLFQENAISFAPDIVANMNNSLSQSRLSTGLGRPLVETDVEVRSFLASVINSHPLSVITSEAKQSQSLQEV